MGWAHNGAVTSSTVSTATMTQVGGSVGVELESATASCLAAVPGPTAAVPGPGSEVPEPPAGFLQSDPATLVAGGTKIVSDSGDGLMDGLRRRWRETPVGIACRVEPIRARASAWSLSARGT